MDYNDYLTEENNKYIDCCTNLMYFYLKSSNEIIYLNDVLANMNGNINENKIILKRILKGLNKSPLFGKVKLSYMDYLKLEEIISKNTNKSSFMPYFMAITTLIVTILGAVVCMMVPTFIYLLVFVFLIALLYYVFKAVK